MEIAILIFIGLLGLAYISIMAYLFMPFSELFPDKDKK